MERSKLTNDLRSKLDAAGIEWSDNTDFLVCDQYIRSIERTWIGDIHTKDPYYPAHQFSIAYGFIKDQKTGIKDSVTHGYPNKLECWCPEFYPEPIALTIEETINLVKKFIVKKD